MGYLPLVERLRARGLADLVMACDRRAEVGPAMAARYGVSRFTDCHHLVGSSDVDLVLVLTSMPLHGPVSRAALQARKHILAEEPLVVTLEEALDLVDLAGRSPGYLLPAPHVILSPTFQTLARRIRRGCGLAPVRVA